MDTNPMYDQFARTLASAAFGLSIYASIVGTGALFSGPKGLTEVEERINDLAIIIAENVDEKASESVVGGGK